MSEMGDKKKSQLQRYNAERTRKTVMSYADRDEEGREWLMKKVKEVGRSKSVINRYEMGGGGAEEKLDWRLRIAREYKEQKMDGFEN